MKCPWIEIEFTEPIDIAGAEIYYFREFQYVNIRAGLNATTMVHHAESWSMDKSNQWITKVIKVRFSNCLQLHKQKNFRMLRTMMSGSHFTYHLEHLSMQSMFCCKLNLMTRETLVSMKLSS